MAENKLSKLRPLEDRLIAEAVKEMETTISGIIIPDTAKEKPQRAKIIAVGPGKVDDSGKRIPMDVKVGDVVLFSKYGPTEVKIDGKEVLILNQSDVLAVLE